MTIAKLLEYTNSAHESKSKKKKKIDPRITYDYSLANNQHKPQSSGNTFMLFGRVLTACGLYLTVSILGIVLRLLLL